MIPVVTTELTKFRDNYKKLIATIKAIPSPVSLKDFIESSDLKKDLGESAAAQIDSKGKRGGKQYAGYVIRSKKVNGKKPAKQRTKEPATLKKTEAVYNELKSGKAFQLSLSPRSKVINISLTNKIALYHQRGTKRLVIRKVFAPTKVDANKITKILKVLIDRAILIGLT